MNRSYYVSSKQCLNLLRAFPICITALLQHQSAALAVMLLMLRLAMGILFPSHLFPSALPKAAPEITSTRTPELRV